MTRRSPREIERALDDLGGDAPDAAIDVPEGVTAPFVTYDSDGFDDEDVPDGYTREKTTSDTGAVYYILCEDDGTEGET